MFWHIRGAGVVVVGGLGWSVREVLEVVQKVGDGSEGERERGD